MPKIIENLNALFAFNNGTLKGTSAKNALSQHNFF